MPLPVLAPIIAAVSPWLARFVAEKGAKWIVSILLKLGIVIGTQKLVIEPIIDAAVNKWSALASSYGCWLSAFGVTTVVSILISGATAAVAKSIFFSRKLS